MFDEADAPPRAAPLESAPTRARYGVLGFLCSLSFVLYLDRVCIGQAVVPIQIDLGLTNTQVGYALGAFTIAYGLFEVPTGRWGDRFGSRGVLTRIVVWWSLFTALTGVATGLAMLVTVRFLFGAGEAGAYPNVARIIARWFPRGERGAAQGIVITSAQLGGALAPVLAAYTIAEIGWRSTFVAFSILGLAWAAAFYVWFRDDPAEHPRTNAAERALVATTESRSPQAQHHPPIPWKVILASRNIWLLGTLQTCSSFLSYMFMGWYPTYLEKGRQLGSLETGKLASLVLFGAAIGCLASGFINDWLARITRYHPVRFRIYGFAGTTIAAVALLASIQCESPTATSILAAVSFMAAISQQATFWAITTEISGAHLGVVFGLMNSMGVPGAFASSMFLGQFVDSMAERGYVGREQWDPAFYVYDGVLVIGACCWLLVDSNQKVPDEAR
ncbi:MAG: MFS transporter [Planctomycetia bacterium]|nr:MFS transporter [Planctomycetia bacterium]